MDTGREEAQALFDNRLKQREFVKLADIWRITMQHTIELLTYESFGDRPGNATVVTKQLTIKKR